jgi:hypothetical protein
MSFEHGKLPAPALAAAGFSLLVSTRASPILTELLKSAAVLRFAMTGGRLENPLYRRHP